MRHLQSVLDASPALSQPCKVDCSISDVLPQADIRVVALEDHGVRRPADDAHWTELSHASFGQNRRRTRGQALRLAFHFGRSSERESVSWFGCIKSSIYTWLPCCRREEPQSGQP